MAQVLQEPGRELVMWPPDRPASGATGDGTLQILGLNPAYSATEPVAIQVAVRDDALDCGDLYVTIYDAATGEVVAQDGFFEQCFAGSNSTIPLNGGFLKTIDEPGNYEIRVVVSDAAGTRTATAGDVFSVG